MAARRQSAVQRSAACVIAVLSAGLVVAADVSTSAPVARELAALMAQEKLQAFAAKDPAAPNTFVAAMLFPDVQLLLVAGEPSVAAAAQAQLDQKQYAALYATLQQAVKPTTKIFFQDLKADGLHSKAADAVDVVYERVSNQTMFDGEPARHHLSDAQYTQKFTQADGRYARLLRVLVDSLKQRAAGTSAGQ